MICTFCKASLDATRTEHLPTDECGTYVFLCGTSLSDGKWDRSKRCAICPGDRVKRPPHPEVTDAEKRTYLWDGGWLQNINGWWHPPSCLASWPLNEAYEMAKKDEAKGLRMTPDEVKAYLARG